MFYSYLRWMQRRSIRWMAVMAAVFFTSVSADFGSAHAANSSLYSVFMTQPSGAIWFAGKLWVSDRLNHLCRIDVPPPPGVTGPGNNAAPAGVGLPQSGNACTFGANTPFQPGQPSFDAATNSVFVPDNSSKSQGVFRFTYNAATDWLGSGVVLAPNQGLGGLRPTASALGPDGNLYVGSLNTGDIKRITNPAGAPASQLVQTIGKSLRGKRVFGLAFVGSDLFLAEASGLSVIRNATACQSGCPAVAISAVPGVETLAIATDGQQIYLTQGSSVLRFTLATGQLATFATTGTLTPDQVAPQGFVGAWTTNCTDLVCPFVFPPGGSSTLALDAQGNLYVGDDPGADRNVLGRIWMIPAGSQPLA